MTLAHELGHGVHQTLASENGYLLSDTPLTLAETASVFGEMLVFQKLLSKADTEENKKSMIFKIFKLFCIFYFFTAILGSERHSIGFAAQF